MGRGGCRGQPDLSVPVLAVSCPRSLPLSCVGLTFSTRSFLYNMPGLRNAKLEYWQENIQPFFDSFAERDLSSTVERGEVTKRCVWCSPLLRVKLTLPLTDACSRSDSSASSAPTTRPATALSGPPRPPARPSR